MSTSPSQRNVALPVMLSVLGLAIIVFLISLTGYLSNRPETEDVSPGAATVSPTQSPAAHTLTSEALSSTYRPSWTPPSSPTITITRTITPTVTRTIIPSLTPANPQTLNTRYQLVPWSLFEADRMIELLTIRANSEQSSDWYYAAAHAQQEALLRFPQAFETSPWRWQYAHTLLRTGDQLAINVYAGLIQAALYSGQVRANSLPGWFHLLEPELTLTTTAFPTQLTELNRLLIQISGAGNAFLWLVETPGNFQVIPLLNDFDPLNNPQAETLLADLTGDDLPELVIYRTLSPAETQFPTPWIFDLSQQPPALMPVQFTLPLELGMESERLLSITPSNQRPDELLLTTRIFPACPVDITRSFQWDGEKFTLSPVQVYIQPDPDLLGWCEIVVDHASLVWAPELTIAMVEPLLASWPPSVDAEGDPYPADALDAWRFRLGILHALAGNHQASIQVVRTILDSPSTPQSTWIESANLFLATYQDSSDLYLACLAAPGCNLRQAIQTLARTSGLTDPSRALVYLQQHGIVTRSSGYFDFDQDGTNERWLSVLPHPGGKLEFWILTATSTGVQAIFIQIFEDNQPQPYFHDAAEIPPIVQLERGTGFIMERDPLTAEAGVHFVEVKYERPTIILDELNSSLQALFMGVDPARVLSALLETRSSPRFIGDCRAFGICAQYYYTLGLVYELTGAERSAIDNYLIVWRGYPLSPYTLMARLKLEIIPSTPTKTPTVTLTPTATYTPDPNRTATSTSSSAYPAPITATQSSYPFPATLTPIPYP